MERTTTEGRLGTAMADVERNTQRRRRILAGAALAATAAVIAVIVAVWSLADDSPETATRAQAPNAAGVATAFVDAYGSYDRGQAATYLADDAALGTWRLDNRWYEAIGLRLLLDSCAEQGTSSAGTRVECTFDFHALHSEQLGRGPYSGNVIYLTVRDSKIATADPVLEYTANGFSSQMWEPFATWVARAHPRDAATMYADWPSQDAPALTSRSIEHWEKHSADYVDEKN